jgi:hypothetical protein
MDVWVYSELDSASTGGLVQGINDKKTTREKRMHEFKKVE